MINKLTAGALAVPVLAIFLSTGCGSQPSHPNQIDALDGATYDTLTLAHGALTSLRAQVSFSYPKYVPVFNQAAAAYGAAYNAYAAFRTNPSDQAEMGVEIDNLTVSIIALENAFQTDMNVSASTVAQVEKRAKKLRRSIRDRVTVSDILTELEIAAAVARTVPAAAPYAALAQVVISSTSQALAAEIAAAGQPIDLTTIQPIAAIQ